VFALKLLKPETLDAVMNSLLICSLSWGQRFNYYSTSTCEYNL